MYKLSKENIEKLEGALNYYIREVSEWEDYEIAKQSISITDNILRILERYSGNNEKVYNFNTANYTSDGK